MIAVIDYGMGNTGSIRNMLLRIGADSIVTSDPEELRRADKLILPGVGSFDMGVRSLQGLGVTSVLTERVMEAKVPVLGICLGMQLLSRRSEEGTLNGLGWIDAETVRFEFAEDQGALRLPHMGWNTVDVRKRGSILDGLSPGARFYFVHTFHVRCARPEDVLSTTRYGIEFHSSVAAGNIFGTQFHPEKSHKFGMRVLSAFVAS